MEIKSSAFESGEMIPGKYTCDGQDISPPLEWSDFTDTARSFAIISDDPDAPVGTWVHWVYYDIPVDTTNLPENIPAENNPTVGGTQGINDFRRIGYGGPCPPGGTHRYFFKIYALDTVLNLNPGLDKKQLLKTMEEHIVDQAELMGRYKR